MRKTTTLALVIAGSALAGTGSGRAQDAAPPQSTTRGSIVLPVGDKVHGYLRGGETHALSVHLAKGDVYSFSVNANKRGDPLVMHLSLLDPNGNEVNADARVVHYAAGKRITVGPYKAPESGTYVIELSAQSWFEGDYWGTSNVRGARKTIVRLPGDGATVDVDVAAGSTIRLRSGSIGNFMMATPFGQANTIAGTDPLVASLRAKGLASGETGTYQFGAPGSRAATIEITKPQWKATVIEVPKLPDDPTRLAQFDFVLNGWKRPPTSVPMQAASQPSNSNSSMAPFGAPVAATAFSSPNATTSLFLGTDVDGMTAIGNFVAPAPSQPATPGASDPDAADASPAPVDPPAPPVAPPVAPPIVPPVAPPATPPIPEGTPPSTSPPPSPPDAPSAPVLGANPVTPPAGAAVAVRGSFAIPTTPGRQLIGASAFLANPQWRDAPWARDQDGYPFVAQGIVMPRVEPGRSIGVAPVNVFIHVSVRFSVDGHEVDTLLATGGDATITWQYSGTIDFDASSWDIEGNWTMRLLSGGPAARSRCSLSGTERATNGSTVESISVPDLMFNPSVGRCDPVGDIQNQLIAPRADIRQTVVRHFDPAWIARDWHSIFKTLLSTTTTIDESTGDEDAVEERRTVRVSVFD